MAKPAPQARPVVTRNGERFQEIVYSWTFHQQEKICPICGATFWARSNSLYDSRECRNKAQYRRTQAEKRD
jgi:hypothetical protein